MLGAFRQAHPDIALRLDIGNRQHVHERLLTNEADFAVVGRTWLRPDVPLTVRPFLPNELISVELRLGVVVEIPVTGFPLRRQWHLVYPRDRRSGPVGDASLSFVDEGGGATPWERT